LSDEDKALWFTEDTGGIFGKKTGKLEQQELGT